MPKQIVDIKRFIPLTARKDASAVRIKKVTKNGKLVTKFKVRCSRHLYTVVVEDQARAEKLKQSFNPGLNVVEVGKVTKGRK
ncbi:putative 60S ribosomal protein L38 [Testicularia cyperi]|uniref:Putative 60S ribosomal protein L38 n=1 Tax=Testicularia cyperi TaxID=1882483 RepID=A0A317XZV5_9BASI|nr:putative 60S ribosomal protein L38 [Testicularia cyperi]